MLFYPTMEQVEAANQVQLARWSRFLPSPGITGIDTPNFPIVLKDETKIMERIVQRFSDLGGMTPEISKQIGWDK